MRKVLEGRLKNIQRMLAAGNRLPGYVSLKLDRVVPSLERAIEKTREGSYGACDDCGRRIADSRLAAVPGAIRCASCQAIHERSKA